MSIQPSSSLRAHQAVIGEPEVVEDGCVSPLDPTWLRLKSAVASLQAVQDTTGAVPDVANHVRARDLVRTVTDCLAALAPRFPHDESYLVACVQDVHRWADENFPVPDFLDSLVEFQPQRDRRDGRQHLVLFPMYTQNGSRDRHLEALLVETIWPEFIRRAEDEYPNPMFVPLRFLDFTDGYETNSAVLFPETVAMRAVPPFSWGAIFQDREAARFRRVAQAAADVTKLDLPEPAARLVGDQLLAEKTFVLWDLLHDRTHMRGDLPFDPFMIKQRMPYFLYALEELRCDLTAFRVCQQLQQDLRVRADVESLNSTDVELLEHAELVQYAVIFDRIFRFAITGTRVRNYDGLGGQLLFAWLHQRGVLHWTDTQLRFDWDDVPAAVIALGDAIDTLYWRSIDRPKTAHWLAAYDLLCSTLSPHPASRWARGLPDEVLSGPPSGLTDAVLDDEFPLSLFYEALERKMRPVIESTKGITGAAA